MRFKGPTRDEFGPCNIQILFSKLTNFAYIGDDRIALSAVSSIPSTAFSIMHTSVTFSVTKFIFLGGVTIGVRVHSKRRTWRGGVRWRDSWRFGWNWREPNMKGKNDCICWKRELIRMMAYLA